MLYNDKIRIGESTRIFRRTYLPFKKSSDVKDVYAEVVK